MKKENKRKGDEGSKVVGVKSRNEIIVGNKALITRLATNFFVNVKSFFLAVRPSVLFSLVHAQRHIIIRRVFHSFSIYIHTSSLPRICPAVLLRLRRRTIYTYIHTLCYQAKPSQAKNVIADFHIHSYVLLALFA